jgi:molybdate transport system substrate-binding protein
MLRLLMILALVAGMARAEPVVFAAASTRGPLDAAIAAQAEGALVSYGASGSIARQIAQGAPADLFISANPKWMQYLVDQGIVDPREIQVLTSNSLVLIAPKDTGKVALAVPDLPDRIGSGFLAVADPDVAPVGQYGRAALTDLGLWDHVAPALLPTRNTISTVATVARGEAALGLVYRSDATGVEGIGVAASIPTDSHPPIHYLIAPVTQGDQPEMAQALIAFLTGPDGQHHFESYGFTAVQKATGS